jgi:hypothetical protein
MYSCEGDPGCVKYYAEMKRIREVLNQSLLPLGGRVTYVGGSHRGDLTAIWYFGKNETGFASAKSEIGLFDRILEIICKGL